jgi:Leucine-rich repeat (LRR) protein
MFPNLSMLDVSNNNLKEIPVNINELSNLSVLNISGNLGKCLRFNSNQLARVTSKI